MLNIAISLVAGDVTSVLRDTTNLEQVREEAKERRKRRKKKRSGSTLIASVFSGEFPLLLIECVCVAVDICEGMLKELCTLL